MIGLRKKIGRIPRDGDLFITSDGDLVLAINEITLGCETCCFHKTGRCMEVYCNCFRYKLYDAAEKKK